MCRIYLSFLSVFLVASCSNNVKLPDTVDLNAWEDSVSYSIGADLGNTFIMREIEFDANEFNKGFYETISNDSSYAYGANIAANMVLSGVEVNAEILLSALNDHISGDSLILSNKDIGATLKKFDDDMRKRIEKRRAEAINKALTGGESFIEKYKKENSNAVETESGLIYRIIKEGFGETPSINDKVIVHYTGKLIDGTVFDSSDYKEEPVSFLITGVIQGWQEALTMMPVGSKWELVIPSVLGYGEKSMGKIPGMSTLIFEVELLGIE